MKAGILLSDCVALKDESDFFSGNDSWIALTTQILEAVKAISGVFPSRNDNSDI